MNWQKLASIIGNDLVVAPEANTQYQLNGLPSLPVIYPATIEQISEVLRFASAEKLAVIPVGGATKLEIGNRPSRAAFFLSTINMNTVLEHPASDLTVTVQAGCTLQALQQTLSQHGQFLPLDAPYRERATIGGIVATNSYGPLRLFYGQVRDWLIGLKVVTADGQISKAGGKVVKNVAGYDLMKLYTGSFGTLAVIAELNFKLRPRPVEVAGVIARVNDLALAQQAAQKLLASQLLPSSFELLNSSAAQIVFPSLINNDDKGDYVIAARFAGSREAIEHQCATVVSWWRELKTTPVVIKQDVDESWQRVADFADHYPHIIAVRAAVMPSRVFALIDELNELLAPLVRDYRLLAHVGNGVVRIFINTDDNGDGEIQSNLRPRWRVAIEGIRIFCAREGGSAVLERAPLRLRELIDTWGEVRSGAQLMHAIKRKLDPENILNPGRFVAGI